MKKITALALSLAICVGLLAGCGTVGSNNGNTRTITDSAGRQVNVPETVESIVCVGVGALRYTCYVGAAELVAGVEDYEATKGIDRLYNYVNHEKFQNLPIIGTNGVPYAEEIIAVAPQVIVMSKSANASLYYPVLAQVGNTQAIAEIRKGYESNYKQAGYEALLTIDNPEMIQVLFEMAQTDKANSQAILNRYTDLVSKSDQKPIQQFQSYSQALALATDVKLQNRLIGLLGGTHAYQALLVVEPYMDNQPTAEAAAGAVRTIVSKNIETLGGEQIRAMLNKAITCFEAVGDADAGYAIDDIKSMLEKLPELETSPKFELSAQEAKEGYEILFDGEDMGYSCGCYCKYRV